MDPTAPPLRLAVQGARRRRQGVGEHLARHAQAAGAHVVAVAGTTAATAREAAEALTRPGQDGPRPFTDLGALLEATAPDVLFVATPPEVHEAALRAALTAGCHVLVEKPVLLGPDAAARAAALGRAFLAAGLHLAVHAQWPWTLPAYFRLHPDVQAGRVERLAWASSPSSKGRRMLADALPHAIALAQALAPHAEAEVLDPAARWSGPQAVDVTFGYRAGARRLGVAVHLRHQREGPRAAALALDGRRADRRLQEPGYRMQWEAPDGRTVPLPDPSAALVGWFLDRVRRAGPSVVDPAISPGATCLQTLLEALDPTAPASPEDRHAP